MTKIYEVLATVWLYEGPIAWHFITIPEAVTKDIDQMFAHAKRGWGSLPVTVSVGKTSWKTSIFPDKKTASYVLPLKASVRRIEHIKVNDIVGFFLKISD